MTNAEIKLEKVNHLKNVLEQGLAGKTIQMLLVNGTWEDQVFDRLIWTNNENTYRVKPEGKLEEVPVKTVTTKKTSESIQSKELVSKYFMVSKLVH